MWFRHTAPFLCLYSPLSNRPKTLSIRSQDPLAAPLGLIIPPSKSHNSLSKVSLIPLLGLIIPPPATLSPRSYVSQFIVQQGVTVLPQTSLLRRLQFAQSIWQFSATVLPPFAAAHPVRPSTTRMSRRTGGPPLLLRVLRRFDQFLHAKAEVLLGQAAIDGLVTRPVEREELRALLLRAL